MVYDLDEAETYFKDFMKTYEKVYHSDIEMEMRFQIFKENMKNIIEQNKKNDAFGITQFSDLTVEEFEIKYTGFRRPIGQTACTVIPNSNFSSFDAPDQFDWRQRQKVTPVKNQQDCGSCWAFSTVGNIEGQYAIVHNQLREFSESQLVDCDSTNHGCSGGFMANAILYVQQVGGIMSEQEYPYTPAQGACRFNPSGVVARVTGCNLYSPVQSEENLKQILVSTGPIAITISATAIKQYTGGIVQACGQERNNHAVLLVGYGTENGVPYWTIKNSWSTSWGEQGYVRIERNRNMCNIVGPDQHIVSAIVA